MNLFDFALTMELDGVANYKELAAKTVHPDLKAVLEGLAAEERRHYDIIKAAQGGEWGIVPEQPALSAVPNVFADKTFDLADQARTIPRLKAEPIDLYRAALDREKESVSLYQELAQKAASPEEKSLCQKLREEEEKHVELMDNIVEMLNRVQDWVESAEFNHQEIY